MRDDTHEGVEKMMKIRYFLLVMIVVLFLVSCATNEVPENKLCSSDSDCVPASYCHANESVNSKFAPKCEGMLCTMECVPETLDCGQGEVKCVEKECKVVFKE